MEKLLCAVLVSSLLLATLAVADDASPSPHSSLKRQRAPALGRRELDMPRGHYRREGKYVEQQPEGAVTMTMEVKQSAEKAGRRVDDDDDDDSSKEGLIYSADYSGVAMHSRSPPVHEHPRP